LHGGNVADAVEIDRLNELRAEAKALRTEAAGCEDTRRRTYLRDLRSNVVFERDQLLEELRSRRSSSR
jgi:hypothetical protein